MVVEFKEGRPYRLEFLQKDHRESENLCTTFGKLEHKKLDVRLKA